MFAQAEGIIPAPESCHAIAAAIREANKCKETGEEKVILFNLSGHGLIDMALSLIHILRHIARMANRQFAVGLIQSNH